MRTTTPKRMNEIVKIESISDMHKVFGLTKPMHPLVSVIRFKGAQIVPEFHHIRCTFGMYCITYKNDTDGSMQYGRNAYDFQEGSMAFIKPGQVLRYDGHQSSAEDPGWALLFHPDLIRKSDLGKSIDGYSSFLMMSLKPCIYLTTKNNLSMSWSQKLRMSINRTLTGIVRK